MGQGWQRYLYAAALLIVLVSQIVQFFTGPGQWVQWSWGVAGLLWVLGGCLVALNEPHGERWLFLLSAVTGLLAAISAFATTIGLAEGTWLALSALAFGAAMFAAALHYGWEHWLYLAPTIAILGFILVYPTLVTAVVSLFENFYGSGKTFVGLANYVQAITSEQGIIAIRNTALWIVLMTSATVGIGLVLAVLLDRVKYESIAKSIIFMPMAVSFTAASIIWQFVYAYQPPSIPQIGVLNAVLMSIQDFVSQPFVSGVLNGLWLVFGILTLGLLLVALTRRAWTAAREWSDEHRISSQAISLVIGLVALGVSFLIDQLGAGVVVAYIGDGLWVIGLIVLFYAAFQDRLIGPALLGGLVFFGLVDFLLSLQDFSVTPWYTTRNWLRNNIVIIFEGIWIWTGFAMVVLSAAYKGIPPQMKDAARIDGANEWQVFWYITIPFMKSTIAVVTTAILVFVLKIFDFVWVTTGGNYGTHVLASLMVEKTQNFNRGLAAVFAMLIMIMVIPIILVNVKQFREQEEVR
ncbi:MAG: carbohydrate ABC transporter permease [Candidatus Bipolaricaulia bacterium]